MSTRGRSSSVISTSNPLSAQLRRERGSVRPREEVPLETDAVDRHAARDESLDQRDETIEVRGESLGLELVQEERRVRIDGAAGLAETTT